MRVTWCAAALAAASWSMLSGTALGESDDTASGSTSSRTSSSTSTSAGTTRRESFTEDLMIKPLADGKVLLHFEFVIERSLAGASNDSQLAHHYHLFPRQIGEIAQRYNVDELHLAFTQGNWREARWGYPPVNSQGVGAEVRARIRGAEEQSAAQWKGLTNALSGVFCASLNFIDETNTITPQLTFTDESASSSTKEGILRQGYLPRENVCTENLTPWIKQLPCQSKSGVGALLNPHRLYNMHFNSMGISLEPVGRTRHGGRPAALRYKQHLSVVLDPRTFGLGSKWTASELVGMQLAPACPVAERSTVRVIIAPGSGVRVTPAASALGKLAGLDMHTFDLKSQRSMGEIELEFDSMGAKESPLPVLGVHRHVTGHGGSSGGVEAVIVNRGDKAVDVTYMDTLPWYLRVYSHTLEIRTQRGGEGAADADADAGADAGAGAGAGAVAERLVPSRLLFSPAVDRGRPSTMELALRLGPQSRTTLRYSFDKGFLKYTEHPPDANRGFNIGPAIVSYTSDAGGGRQQPLYCAIGATLLLADNTTAVDGGGGGGGGCVVRAYSELFLASLPTPDFSMPYNVITFTCTILALFFGRIFNLLTRDFAVLNDEKAGKEEGDGVAVEVK